VPLTGVSTSVRILIESFAAYCSLPPMQDTNTPREPTGNVALEFCRSQADVDIGYTRFCRRLRSELVNLLTYGLEVLAFLSSSTSAAAFLSPFLASFVRHLHPMRTLYCSASSLKVATGCKLHVRCSETLSSHISLCGADHCAYNCPQHVGFQSRY